MIEFSPEEKDLLDSYCRRNYIKNVYEKQETEMEILILNGNGSNWTLSSFLDLIRDAAKKVPEEFREKINVNIDYVDYGGATFTLSYTRLETDEEFATKIASYLKAARQHEFNEKKEYERLCEKYHR